MKSYLSILLVALFFVACKKESTPTLILNETVDLTRSTAKRVGDGFTSGPYGPVSGNAKVYQAADSSYQVSLENFSTVNGPDLKVYLSSEIQPLNYVNLGSLKSTKGDQLYDVPPQLNINNYQYVLIYCQQYKRAFGYTKLTN